MRHAFIENHRQRWTVAVQCRVLQVTPSGFYAWMRREPSARIRHRAALTDQIRAAHVASRQVYGAPRIHQDLLAQGQQCNRKTVAKCMREAGIRAKTPRPLRVTSATILNHMAFRPMPPSRVDCFYCRGLLFFKVGGCSSGQQTGLDRDDVGRLVSSHSN